MNSFTDIAEVRTEPHRAWVYEHGWQSWSPTGRYPATTTSPRPARRERQVTGYRPGKAGPPTGFQGEGLAGVLAPDEPTRLWFAPDPRAEVASIRVRAEADRLVVSADGPVRDVTVEADLSSALAGWAEELALDAGVKPVPRLLPAWCSWYAYGRGVSEMDVLGNLAAIDRLHLEISTIQIDDGHQAEVGDWLERSPRFGPLEQLAERIVGSGRRAGLWTAPFLVGARSRLAAEHPDWLVGGAIAARHHWGQEVRVLDVTHPEAAEHLLDVYRTLTQEGFTYHKLDFLYAGAIDGRRHGDATAIDAYRHGLRLVREAVGDEATLLAAGAPLLPSVGLVDAMRVSPDVDPRSDPEGGDLSEPSVRSALAAGRARAWMHARLWVNDPDCILVRPEVQRRDDWAAHLDAYAALAVSGDPLDALDAQGLSLTRELLRPSSTEPVDWLPHAGPDQGAVGRETGAP